MSGETERNVSGWTTDTLKELEDVKIRQLRELMDERDRRYGAERDAGQAAVKSAFAAAEAAAAKLEANQKHTNEVQNEWRGTVQDFKDETVSRESHDDAVKRLDEKLERNTADIQKIENQMAGGQGGQVALLQRRTQANWIIGLIVIVIGMVVGWFLSVVGLAATLVYFLAGKH